MAASTNTSYTNKFEYAYNMRSRETLYPNKNNQLHYCNHFINHDVDLIATLRK